jgi:hypothetical protein
LDDPRCLLPLLAKSEDSAADPVIRERALTVLSQSLMHPTGTDLRRWWASGDPLLKKAALSLMTRSESDIVAAALEDDQWAAVALSSITFGFQEPEWQQRKVDRLNSTDPETVVAAARCLFWDEPNIAEGPLLNLLDTGSSNAAAEAALTLGYYPSRRVIPALTKYGFPSILKERETHDPLDNALDSFRWALSEPEPVASRMRTWMGSISLIAQPFEPEPSPSIEAESVRIVDQSSEPTKTIWSLELLARINNPNAPIRMLIDDLRRLNLDAIPADDRMRITALLCRHPDANLRERGASVAAAWGLSDPLLELFDDPSVSVRKTALYVAHDLPQNAKVAERVLERLESGLIASTQGREALRTWVRHVDRQVAVKRLIRFARDDQRESIVVGAIEELVTLELGTIEGGEAVTRLTDLLRRDALCTWAVHVTLLDACARMNIDPGNIEHLRTVDNVWVATAIAKLDAARNS